jgi:hypothetical protein
VEGQVTLSLKRAKKGTAHERAASSVALFFELGVRANDKRERSASPKFLHRKTITAGNDWEMLKGRWFVLATFDN